MKSSKMGETSHKKPSKKNYLSSTRAPNCFAANTKWMATSLENSIVVPQYLQQPSRPTIARNKKARGSLDMIEPVDIPVDIELHTGDWIGRCAYIHDSRYRDVGINFKSAPCHLQISILNCSVH